VDELVVFNQLDKEDMRKIVEIEMAKVVERLSAKHHVLQVGDDVLEDLVEKSFNADFGARPLKRALEREVEDPLSEEILRGGLEDARLITASMKDGKIHFDIEKKVEDNDVENSVETEQSS
jgi:ATP-dependent Clp protease ATP-binding subunit ClpC